MGENININSNKNTDISFKNIINMEHPELLMQKFEPFNRLMMEYHCAIMEIETKLKVLDAEFSLNHNRNPIEDIRTRIKTPVSIIDKMKRKGFPFSVASIEKNLSDVAGIRVICSFPEDIYTVKEMLICQDDITLLEEKDYIKNPKPNGYRSLHLIVGIPIFLATGKKEMKAEIQLRTIAMECWASLEHKMKYKKDIRNADEISRKLIHCAQISYELDQEMQAIRNEINMENPQRQYL